MDTRDLPLPFRLTLHEYREHLAARGLRPLTVRDYSEKALPFLRYLMSRHIEDFREVSLMTLEAYRAHLLEGEEGKAPLKLRTVGLRLSQIKAFFRFLYKTGRVYQDTAAALALPKRAKSLPKGILEVAQAEALPGMPGPYLLQAEIAACHARARRGADTDWRRIAALYAALSQLTGSPVVELNRAVAVSMAEGPAAGCGSPQMAEKPGKSSVRGYPQPWVKSEYLSPGPTPTASLPWWKPSGVKQGFTAPTMPGPGGLWYPPTMISSRAPGTTWKSLPTPRTPTSYTSSMPL